MFGHSLAVTLLFKIIQIIRLANYQNYREFIPMRIQIEREVSIEFTDMS